MERGMIKSYDRTSGSGTISRSESTDLQFNANRVLGNRNDLHQGDGVWFEVETMHGNHVAINIRKTG